MPSRNSWPSISRGACPNRLAKGHEFKDTELRQVVRDAELGKRFADALVQVTLEAGEQRWIYIHIEIQGRRDGGFARRMFTYNYRLFDRYARPIASLFVLADEDKGWRPDHCGFEVLGCRHILQFPIIKLIDYADCAESLEANPQPFRTRHRRASAYPSDQKRPAGALSGQVRSRASAVRVKWPPKTGQLGKL
uniref:Transposase, YhgA-like n=1 Tax=Candidatus Kentrum sp. LFY TaxID=2126342 RepID=A0A450X3Y7_9GAMM|nr:MAG: Putative transposase, YhgA-like [Candidatus Kentron sp. LFY]